MTTATYADVDKSLRAAFGPTPLFEESAKRDEWIEANAAYFTAIRGVGHARMRLEFPTKDAAVRFRDWLDDGRTMIYAVAPDGASAHLCNT